MLTIRLSRVGKNKNPEYRVVVTPKTSAAQGYYLERIGHYNPKTKQLTLNNEKMSGWLGKGAQPSNTLAKLLKKQGFALPAWVKITERKRAPKKAAPAEEPKVVAEGAKESAEPAAEDNKAEEAATEESTPAEKQVEETVAESKAEEA